MNLPSFTKEDFQVFTINGLDERMAAIRTRIQPKFKLIGTELTADLSTLIGDEMFLHIAKHARRTVNPPKDTWLAIGPNKRGYKQYPHFQLGLFDDHLFIWLAFIYELPNKTEIATKLMDQMDTIKQLIPSDFVISRDHMVKGANPVSDIELQEALHRFQTVKKAELLIGRNIQHDDEILSKPEELYTLALNTFKTLIPIYKMAYSS